MIDFIDMVLESNRDLVLRRLTECLGRDRTRHQVAEVTSLGLVQMTRKKVGTGLLEAYSTTCEHCKGRGVVVSAEPTNVRSQPAAAVVPSGASAMPSGARDSGNGNGRRVKSRGRGTAAVPAAAEQTVIEEVPVTAVAADPGAADHVAEDQIAVDRVAPDDVALDDRAPDDTAPDDTAPDDTARDDTARDDTAPDDMEASATDAPTVPPQPATRTMARRRRAASRPAGPPTTELTESTESPTQSFAVPHAR